MMLLRSRSILDGSIMMVINGLLMVNNMVYWYNGNWYNN
jgi:hypothetical protein